MIVQFFTQASCAPCRVVKPIITSLCQEAGAQLEIVDIISEKEKTTRAGVWATPTTIVLDDNRKEIARLNTKTEVETRLKDLLKPQNTEGGQTSSKTKKIVVGGLFALLLAALFSK